jgi:hypothetical protein
MCTEPDVLLALTLLDGAVDTETVVLAGDHLQAVLLELSLHGPIMIQVRRATSLDLERAAAARAGLSLLEHRAMRAARARLAGDTPYQSPPTIPGAGRRRRRPFRGPAS